MSVAKSNWHSWPSYVSSNVKLHSWQLDVSINVKLAFLTTRSQYQCEIAIQHLGGPSAKVGSPTKLCVLIFKESLLDYLVDPSAKVCSPAKCCVLASKASMLYVGGPLAKVGSSAKFGVEVFKASILDYPKGCWSAKVCSSARFCVLVFKANITCQSWNLLLSFGGVLGVLRGVTSDMTVQC